MVARDRPNFVVHCATLSNELVASYRDQRIAAGAVGGRPLCKYSRPSARK